MDLKQYFELHSGIGVLATADNKGNVNTALYANPVFVERDTCVFLMADRRSHQNIQENPQASYLFMQSVGHYQGKRLYLTKRKESQDADILGKLRNQQSGCLLCDEDSMYAVYFKVYAVRPLVGDTAEHTHETIDTCPTCLQKTGPAGHLCVPADKADETCAWCAALVPNGRHLCNDKVKALAYICNSCGRTAVKAEHLCQPQNIEKNM